MCHSAALWEEALHVTLIHVDANLLPLVYIQQIIFTVAVK